MSSARSPRHRLRIGRGPWVTGWLHDRTGDYVLAFEVGIAASLISAVAIWLAAPRKVRLVADVFRARALRRRSRPAPDRPRGAHAAYTAGVWRTSTLMTKHGVMPGGCAGPPFGWRTRRTRSGAAEQWRAPVPLRLEACPDRVPAQRAGIRRRPARRAAPSLPPRPWPTRACLSRDPHSARSIDEWARTRARRGWRGSRAPPTTWRRRCAPRRAHADAPARRVRTGRPSRCSAISATPRSPFSDRLRQIMATDEPRFPPSTPIAWPRSGSISGSSRAMSSRRSAAIVRARFAFFWCAPETEWSRAGHQMDSRGGARSTTFSP